jgi:hypothetical protein
MWSVRVLEVDGGPLAIGFAGFADAKTFGIQGGNAA